MVEVDRFALNRLGRLARTVRDAYDQFDFQTIFHLINEFVTVDLSAFYLDVSKDRLYTFGPDSDARRSAQTACYVLADGLARLLAPILSITAEEVWRHLPGDREPSVHLAEFGSGTDAWIDDALDARWGRLLEVRGVVNLALEGARQRKEIGSALAAHVRVRAGDAHAALLEQYGADLPMLFITSSATVERGGSNLEAEVTRAAGDKCPRCWRFVERIVPDGDCAGLCERCADAVGGTVASSR
jgi:isoleucyl-tRNA synthetase